jgi:inosine-uridine nucleoside N-ribohydrolase
MALYFALAHPAIDLVGITTTFGNVSVEQATTNALYLTANWPGATSPSRKVSPPHGVKTPEAPPAHIHGADGLGNLGARRAPERKAWIPAARPSSSSTWRVPIPARSRWSPWGLWAT